MKHYVVAGGAGFLGSHLSRALIAAGNKVTIVDNLVTGNKDNIADLLDKNVIFMNHDIREPLTITEKVDVVCNLASPASPVDYFKQPLETLQTNSLGTQNLLELAKTHKARFFHTSTSEVYGDPSVHPQPETYFGNVNPYCERSCYDEGKRYAETLIHVYRHHYGVNTGFIRIFNTYGPNMKPFDGRVVSTFIRQALKGEDITMHGTGKQTRSFCYVDDQIAGILAMINSEEEGPINIGNPEEFTMLELADKVIAMTGSHSKVVFVAPNPSDPKQRRPDISVAKQKLDWEPKVSLAVGLQRTIDWFKEQQF